MAALVGIHANHDQVQRVSSSPTAPRTSRSEWGRARVNRAWSALLSGHEPHRPEPGGAAHRDKPPAL